MKKRDILFMDIEVTCFNPAEGSILELGMVLACPKLTEIGHISFLPRPYKEMATLMSPSVRQMHTNSGLLEDSKGAMLTRAQVAKRAVHWIRCQGIYDKPVLAGRNLHFCKKWIERHMPELANALHHDIMDVTGVQELFKHMYGYDYLPRREDTNRAVDGCLYSMHILKHYRQYFKEPR